MKYQVDTYFKDVKALVKRYAKARSLFEEWRAIHEEAYEYSMPDKETFSTHAQGSKKNRHVYDSTAINGLEVFSNKIQYGFFPAWMHWAEFKLGDDIPKTKKRVMEQDLAKGQKAFFDEFQRTNFSTEINPSLKQYGIGTGCIEIESGVFGRKEPAFHFISVPLPELCLEPCAYGVIKNSWRKHKISLEQIKHIWPKADFDKSMQTSYDKDPNTEIEIINGHLYQPIKDRYFQYILLDGKSHLIFAQDFATIRRIVFRESVTPGEPYGRGPIIRMLPDIQTLNLVKDFTLRNGAIQMSGMYTAVDDGVFNPYTAKVAPGTILPVASNSSQNPTLQRLESSGDIGLGQLIIKDLQDGINMALFAQPLGDAGAPVKSAMENLLRHQADAKRSGTSFERLFTELIIPIIEAGTDILRQRNMFPDILVDNKQVKIKMVSPLAKQKELEDFQNSQIYLENVLQLPKEVAMVSVPFEKFPAYWAEKLNIPEELTRSDEEIKKITETIAGMQQDILSQQQEQEQQAQPPAPGPGM